MAFDSTAFDGAAFDTGAAPSGVAGFSAVVSMFSAGAAGFSAVVAGVEVGAAGFSAAVAMFSSGEAGFPAVVSVVDPLVFDSDAGRIEWYSTVIIGGVDVSARLSGVLRISGAEDSARVASLFVTPASKAEFDAYDSAPITIDYTLFLPGQQATYRRFTGVVEVVDLDHDNRLASLTCRDGYQERIKACTTAAEVEALLGDSATPCSRIVEWDDADPDPVQYFNALRQTACASLAIDSSGVWQVTPWTIGAPAATFTAADVFDGSVKLKRPSRADVPAAIVARLKHRFYRLHDAAVSMSWEAVDMLRYVVDLLPTAQKSMVMAALEGCAGWVIKGTPNLVSPVPGIYRVGPSLLVDSFYSISPTEAELTCQSFTATLVRRWYQQVEVTYEVSIDMGGASDRDESISASIESEFDAGAWESTPSTESSNGIYRDNAPPDDEDATPKTGYEGLPQPWPGTNTALDYFGDIDADELNRAGRYVVARALRVAADGKRRQQVLFERPLDPRWEIGVVLGINARGLSGAGQMVSFDDVLDHDSGEVVSAFSLACPAGTGAVDGVTAFAATLAHPENDIVHGFYLAAPLSNHIGAAAETPIRPNEDTLLGFLCNVAPTSENYDPAKPVYEPQFRIVMPEIPAQNRDPVELTMPIAASIQIGGNGVEVVF